MRTVPAQSQLTALQMLRSLTRDAHRHVERRVQPDLRWTESRYLSFLRATLAVVVAVEPMLQNRFGAAIPMLTSASDRLRSDIATLGGTSVVDAMAIPSIDTTEAEAFGSAYVLLGSLRGGQVLAKALAADLGLPSGAMRYFGSAREVADSWTGFLSALERWGSSTDERQWALSGMSALATFGAFDRAFTLEGFP